MTNEIQRSNGTGADRTIQATQAANESVKRTTAVTVRRPKRATSRAATAAKRNVTTFPKAGVPTRSAKSRGDKTAPRRKTAEREIALPTTNWNNWFAGMNGIPATVSFQALFADAGDRRQEAMKSSQKSIEELAEVSRANAEALVEASKIAIEVARRLGQDVIETSRKGVENAADAIRGLAKAKSPTEFMQLQAEFARAQFERFAAESSRLTENFVKLAGEAVQPIQARATLNAKRFNKLAA